MRWRTLTAHKPYALIPPTHCRRISIRRPLALHPPMRPLPENPTFAPESSLVEHGGHLVDVGTLHDAAQLAIGNSVRERPKRKAQRQRRQPADTRDRAVAYDLGGA